MMWVRLLYLGSNADEYKVLLYNFFEDSTATLSQWRLVLNGVERKDRDCEAPAFDETRHASICSEVNRSLFLRFLIFDRDGPIDS